MNAADDNPGRTSGPYRPSPQDIRQACERIQASWSPRERDKRAGRLPKATWMPPSITLSSVDDVTEEDPTESHRQSGSVTAQWTN